MVVLVGGGCSSVVVVVVVVVVLSSSPSPYQECQLESSESISDAKDIQTLLPVASGSQSHSDWVIVVLSLSSVVVVVVASAPQAVMVSHFVVVVDVDVREPPTVVQDSPSITVHLGAVSPLSHPS